MTVSGNENQTTVYERSFKSGTRVQVNITMTDDAALVDEWRHRNFPGDGEGGVPESSPLPSSPPSTAQQLTTTHIFWTLEQRQHHGRSGVQVRVESRRGFSMGFSRSGVFWLLFPFPQKSSQVSQVKFLLST